MNKSKNIDAWLQGIEILCELEAMKSLNKERELNGFSIGYSEAAFYNLADKVKEIRKEL